MAGIEQEVRRDLSVGVRFVYRNVGRVLEDIAINLEAPCVQLPDGRCVPPALRAEDFLDCSQPPVCQFVDSGFFITNLDGHYPGSPDLSREFKALEFTADKRLSDRWQLLASYRYAQLTGNYEGLFRRDNGQSAPHLTSTDFAVSPFIGFTYEEGPLPNDIRHSMKLFASYQWDMGLNTGLSFTFSGGRPITELGAIPRYGNNERLLTPRGALGRTDSIVTLDLHADYAIRISKGGQRISLGLDVFNLFNSQSVIAVVQNSEIQNPNSYTAFPGLDFLSPALYQEPRSIRFILRYSF
jgi:hypothetical protein